MADLEVTCIIKPNLDSTHEHITHLGGYGWFATREKVIQNIENNTDTFYVLDPTNRRRSDVGVVRQLGQNPYLRTYADGYYNNNLLSLDQCPTR